MGSLASREESHDRRGITAVLMAAMAWANLAGYRPKDVRIGALED